MNRFYKTLKLPDSFDQGYFAAGEPSTWHLRNPVFYLSERTLAVIFRFARGRITDAKSVRDEPPFDEFFENIGYEQAHGAYGLAHHLMSVREVANSLGLR
jgi:hypothetical protein